MNALSLLRQFLQDKEPIIQMQNVYTKQTVGVVVARIVEITEVSQDHVRVHTDAAREDLSYYDFKTSPLT